MVGVIYWCPY